MLLDFGPIAKNFFIRAFGLAMPVSVINRVGGPTVAVNVKGLKIERLSIGQRLELIEPIWNTLPEHVAPEECPPGTRQNSPDGAHRPTPSWEWASRGGKFWDRSRSKSWRCL